MAYLLQINEYQRNLIHNAMKAYMETNSEKLATEPGDWDDSAKGELEMLINMTAPNELSTDGIINGLCL